jgi:hypothetical protein
MKLLARDKHVMPWRIEDEMRRLEASYVSAGLWRECAIRDGNLIKGSNILPVRNRRYAKDCRSDESTLEKECFMSQQALFGVSVAFSFVAWGIVAGQYIWPVARSQPRAVALRPILLLHCFRFVGLAFLVPGIVSPDLSTAFARPAAYGDLATATLALLAIATLRTRLGIILVWAFNMLGSADLLYAIYEGNRTGLTPGLQGATFFITTVLVPLLLITHALVFRLLVQRDSYGSQRAV